MQLVTLFTLTLSIPVILCAKEFVIKYDGILLDDILKNEPLMEKYGDCILEAGPCTDDGKILKKNIPDALTSSCSKCGGEQTFATNKILDFLIENRKAWYDEIAQKYDKEGVYLKKYKERKSKTTA